MGVVSEADSIDLFGNALYQEPTTKEMASGQVKKIKLEVCECGQFESFGDDKIRGMGEINENEFDRYQYSSISMMPSDIIFAQVLDFLDFINVEDVRRFKNNMKNYPTD